MALEKGFFSSKCTRRVYTSFIQTENVKNCIFVRILAVSRTMTAELGSNGGKGPPGRSYKKDCSYFIEVKDNKVITPQDVIKVVETNCGVWALYACVPKGANGYEVTLDSRASAQVLLDGMTIRGKSCEVVELVKTYIVVSFLHIPAYIEDDELVHKLESLNVTVLSPIQRRVYPGTNIVDGTRFVKVKLPPELPSIPYTVRLDNAYYRVVHNNQKRMCSLCHSIEHLFKECPKFICFKCKGQGHYVRNCTTPPCERCGKVRADCPCVPVDDSVNVDDSGTSAVLKQCLACSSFDCTCMPDVDKHRCVECDKVVCVCSTIPAVDDRNSESLECDEEVSRSEDTREVSRSEDTRGGFVLRGYRDGGVGVGCCRLSG